MRHRLLLALLLVFLCARVQAAIYVNQSSSPASILSVDPSTGLIQTVVAGPGGFIAGRAIAIDPMTGVMYLSTTAGLAMSTVSGGPVVPLAIPPSITGLGRIVDIELSHLAGKVYYLDDSGNVLTSDLAGSNFAVLRTGGDIRTDGLAVDVGRGLVYLNAITYDPASTMYRHAIRVVSLDGSNERTFADVAMVNAFSSGGSSADLEVDLPSGSVFMSDRFSASVYAYTVDGLLDEVLFKGGINDLWGPMAYDSISQTLILTAPEVAGANGQLWSVSLADRTVSTIVGGDSIGLAYGFYGVDVGPASSVPPIGGAIPEPSTGMLAAAALLGLGLRRRQVPTMRGSAGVEATASRKASSGAGT